MSRRILVTSALPYANGALHIGHMLEYIQTDVWVRYQRLMGNDCQWVWADDAHGTPIMLKAQAEGIEPEQLIARVKTEHERDIAGFLLSPDNFHTTHSEENRELANLIYERNRDNGNIVRRTIKQLYDREREMFLPDRFVKGICPNCGTPDQYGDNCENCSATYDATDLKEPISQVSGTTPELRDSEQLFFALGNFSEMLREWTDSGTLQPEVANKLREWLEGGLKDWDISRNAPYFGFEIPDAPGKYFYVWLDAPIAYIASHKNLAARTGEDWEASWKPDSDVELYHFIGKDIINFHGLFWPAMLEGAGFRKPTGVFCHGFLTVDNLKMSKSRGTSITIETWLKHLQPEYLRYYFASKLSGSVVDLNMNFDDFITRVNADLVGKVVNIASRCAGFISKRFDGKLAATYPADMIEDYRHFTSAQSIIMQYYEQREYGKAMREIMLLAEHANTYINDAEPWVKIKDPEQAEAVQQICTVGLNYFRIIATYLSPVLPELASKTEQFLNTSLTLASLEQPLCDHAINRFQPMMTRVEASQIEKVMEETKANADAQKPAASAAGSKAEASLEPLKPEIEIDDFDKVDLRVALITDAQPVEGADKLVQLTLDIGIETRTVFAGIKAAYDPADLIGRRTVMVANLKPRKMRFGLSSGMVLAAGPGGSDLFILTPDDGATAGMRVK
ncbi:methionine--tRNA ligase [Granulosicoccus sp. 3-233]|uniref:methionine--tRNA ligase n=1 Tax=Granulosicoccus sp. 3-233 TaxID=3417969 RepID=UPI003D33A76A